MWKFLLVVLLIPSVARGETVHFPGPGGVELRGELIRPTVPIQVPAIVLLHGCGGPYPARDRQWAERLAGLGHILLFPDSFGSRGLGSQCRAKDRAVTAWGLRRQDAIAAAKFLRAQPWMGGPIALMGWSNGGETVLATAQEQADQTAGLFVGFVALYPGCGAASRLGDYRPLGKMLILQGENDDWTQVGPCRTLAGQVPDRIKLVVYPDAYHDFDVPNHPLRALTGLALPPGGIAHVGSNDPARLDALRIVPAFLAGLR
jgi:dienelactone hydrolase